MKATTTAYIAAGRRGTYNPKEDPTKEIPWGHLFIISADLEDANTGDKEGRVYGSMPMKVKCLPEVFDNLPGPLPGEYQILVELKSGKELGGSIEVLSIDPLPEETTKPSSRSSAKGNGSSTSNAAA